MIRKQIISLWGSRGVVYQVARELKSNPLAAIMYLLSMVIPNIGLLHFGDVLDAVASGTPPFLIGFEFELISLMLLAISLWLWTRSAVMRGFAKRFIIALFATVVLNFSLTVFLNYLSFAIYSVLADSALTVPLETELAVFFYVSMIFSLPVRAYLMCLIAQIPLSETVTFRVPLRIFAAVVIMKLGINIVGIIIAQILSFAQLSLWLQLSFVILNPLTTLVFIAAMTAFSRYFIKLKAEALYGRRLNG